MVIKESFVGQKEVLGRSCVALLTIDAIYLIYSPLFRQEPLSFKKSLSTTLSPHLSNSATHFTLHSSSCFC